MNALLPAAGCPVMVTRFLYSPACYLPGPFAGSGALSDSDGVFYLSMNSTDHGQHTCRCLCFQMASMSLPVRCMLWLRTGHCQAQTQSKFERRFLMSRLQPACGRQCLWGERTRSHALFVGRVASAPSVDVWLTKPIQRASSWENTFPYVL